MNLDGSIKPVYSFSEVLDGNKGLVQSVIRHDLPNPYAISPGNNTVAGNRDGLDFPLFFAMHGNLTGNGFANNWHNIRNASLDTQDDGLHNGSQGVAFVHSHDNLPGGFPFLKNVAYAYTLLRPATRWSISMPKEFGTGRDFPDGRQGRRARRVLRRTRSRKLVDIRNTHGRGEFPGTVDRRNTMVLQHLRL